MKSHWMTRTILVTALLAACSGCVVHSEDNFAFHSFADGAERAERSESLPLELRSGDECQVEVLFGDIALRVADDSTSQLEAHWHANAQDKASAEAVLARYRLEIVRGQGSLSIRVVGEPLEVQRDGSTQRLAASVDLKLVVPAGVRLVARSDSGNLKASGELAGCSLTSSYGDVSAAGIRGATSVTTSSGSATIESIEGPSVEAQSQYGDVRAEKVRAEKVHLSTSSGGVAAKQIEGTLTISSGYGDIAVEGCAGQLDARTSSGDISVGSPVDAARRTLVTSYGDVRVQGAAGELDASTSSGEVSIEAVQGSVRAVSSYGDVSVEGRISQLTAVTSSGSVVVKAALGSTATAGDWSVLTNYGDVSLQLPADFACTLRASAPTGDLICGFAMDLRSADGKQLHALDSTLGSGGSKVQVESASGDVSITASKP